MVEFGMHAARSTYACLCMFMMQVRIARNHFIPIYSVIPVYVATEVSPVHAIPSSVVNTRLQYAPP